MVKKFPFLTIQAVVCNNLVKCKYSFNVEKLFQIIQLSISTQFKCKYGLIVKSHFYFKLFSFTQTIHFSMSMLLILFNP